MKFRSAYSDTVRKISPSGSRFKASFIRELKADGTKTLKRGNDENIYQLIQTAAHGTLVADLISRSNNGDQSAILPSDGTITDLSNMPTNYIDVLNKINLARSTYHNLPTEVKQSFGNSFDSFMAAVQDGTFTKDYKLTRKTATPSAESVKLEEIKTLLKELKS